MFRLCSWICVTWQSYPALLPSSLILIIPDKQVCEEKLRWAPRWVYARAFFLFRFHNHETGTKNKRRRKKKVIVKKGSEVRSKTEKFFFFFSAFLWRLSVSRHFTRSDKWQPETGKELCVTAVKGTDQISHSLLRAAKIKGGNSPVLCSNLFFYPCKGAMRDLIITCERAKHTACAEKSKIINNRWHCLR